MNPIRFSAIALAFVIGGSAAAQDKGTLNPKPLPPIADPSDPKLAAKELFGRRTTPADLRSRSIGSYARGCVAGAAAIPVDGENWQVMRLSRNRNWGHPEMIGFLQRFASRSTRPTRFGCPNARLRDRRMTCQVLPSTGMATAPATQPRA